MCNEISNLIVSGNGGVLYFENQISTYQYLRVLRTLSFDPEHQIWAIVLIFPVGEGNKLIDRKRIQETVCTMFRIAKIRCCDTVGDGRGTTEPSDKISTPPKG